MLLCWRVCVWLCPWLCELACVIGQSWAVKMNTCTASEIDKRCRYLLRAALENYRRWRTDCFSEAAVDAPALIQVLSSKAPSLSLTNSLCGQHNGSFQSGVNDAETYREARQWLGPVVWAFSVRGVSPRHVRGERFRLVYDTMPKKLSSFSTHLFVVPLH